MTDWLYTKSGAPVAFTIDEKIYDPYGHPLGRVRDGHVYRRDGRYIGELEREMVLDKHRSRSSISSMSASSTRASPA